MSSDIIVDLEKCTGCGLCVSVCPTVTLSIINKKSSVAYSHRCISCAHCAAICPRGALTSNRFSVASLEGNEIEKNLSGKRSVREFKDETIPAEILDRIVYFGEKAPAAKNVRNRKYIIVSDIDKIDEIERAVISKYQNYGKILEPARIAVKIFSPKKSEKLKRMSHEFRHMKKSLYDKGHPIFCGAKALIIILSPKHDIFAKDNCFASQNYMMLYAESVGVGSCINGYSQITHKAVEKIIECPKGYRVYAVSMFGYPKYKYQNTTEFKTDIIKKYE
ncbi:MAG: nitroreductase family protein [Methanocorpusculum sp.]|nr:nitroreductase family protein [Methanocorpusculum sp.]